MKALRWLAATAVVAAVVWVSAGRVEAQGKAAKTGRGKANSDLRAPDKLKVGDRAPDFALKTLAGKKTVRLSSFEGRKPVVLVFGSYT